MKTYYLKAKSMVKENEHYIATAFCANSDEDAVNTIADMLISRPSAALTLRDAVLVGVHGVFDPNAVHDSDMVVHYADVCTVEEILQYLHVGNKPEGK